MDARQRKEIVEAEKKTIKSEILSFEGVAGFDVYNERYY